MKLQELIDMLPDGVTPSQVEIFVDRDDTHAFGYEPDVQDWPVDPDEVDASENVKLWLTLSPGGAYVVLPDEDDEDDDLPIGRGLDDDALRTLDIHKHKH